MTDLSRGALIFQHGADGPPGVLGQWLEARGVPMEVIDLKADGRRPPDPAEFALVASLGSECSVTDALPPDYPNAYDAIFTMECPEVERTGYQVLPGPVFEKARQPGADAVVVHGAILEMRNPRLGTR